MFSYAVLEAISTGITASRWHAVSMREAPIGYFFFLGLYVFGAFMSLKSLLLNPSEGAPAKAGHRRWKRMVVRQVTRKPGSEG